MHPRANLQLIDNVYVYVASETQGNGKKLTAREISVALGMLKSLVNRCLKKLVRFQYLGIAKGGKSRFFVSEESKDGTLGSSFFTRQDIGDAVTKNFSIVAGIYESNPALLDSERRGLLKKTKASIGTSKPNYVACEKLVDYLWSKGFNDVKKVLPRNSAHRYSK